MELLSSSLLQLENIIGNTNANKNNTFFIFNTLLLNYDLFLVLRSLEIDNKRTWTNRFVYVLSGIGKHPCSISEQ